MSTRLNAGFVFVMVAIVVTSACTTPSKRMPLSCHRWDAAGTWSISQSNGFAITFILQQKQEAVTGTADNGSGPVPVSGSIHDNELTMTVSWASGGAGRYTATFSSAGLLVEGFTQNLSMPVSTATWNTAQQFKCAERSH